MTSWWMILGGTLLAALSFGAGSWRSGRALNQAYGEGWERCAARLRARQLERLRAGYMLFLRPASDPAKDTARWELPPRWMLEQTPDLPEPERQRDLVQVPRLGGYIRSPIEQNPTAGDKFWRSEPNGSRLMNDHQVRAELAAIAEEPPRAAASGLAEVSGPGHPASAITDTHWTRLVGREFFDEQQAWSEDLDWRLLTWAVGLMGKEGAGRMLEAAR